MTAIDNSTLVAAFCPEHNNGDTFIYTEMLDRSKRKGNNGVRLLKTFFHRSAEEFWNQWPTIKQLCDLGGVRACTRLAPRSYRKVGMEFTRLVVDSSLSGNWAGMKSLYNRACGIAKPNEKLWLLDVDDKEHPEAERIRSELAWLQVFVAAIPSRKGWHIITRPFRRGADGGVPAVVVPPDIQVHLDNPTNLYIPDGAA